MSKPYRVLITGSRTWEDWGAIGGALTDAAGDRDPGSIVLVHGTAAGADTMAAIDAGGRGWTIEPHPADWNRHGRAAGFRRNAEMVASGADVCLAFIRDGSRGATHCAEAARKAGIPVRYFRA